MHRRVNQPSWLVLAVVVSASQATLASAQGADVRWANQRVTIAATEASLSDVLREFAVRTGSRVVGLEFGTERVTVDIRDAYLLDALRRLLADVAVNYLYMPIETATGAPRVAVHLYGRSAPRAGTPRIVVDATANAVDNPVASAGYAPVFRDDEVTRLSREGAFDRNATQASLLGLAKSPDPDVRILSLQTLALQPTDAAVDAIEAALRDDSLFVRGEAMVLIRALATSADGLPRLRALIDHPDAEVRGVAAMALAEHPGDEASDLIKRALNDEDGAVRGFAAQAQRQRESRKPRR